MRKRMIMVIVVASIASAVKANPYEIRKASDHLQVLYEKLENTKEDLDAVKTSYKSLKKAVSKQEKLLDRMEESYKQNIQAEIDAIKAQDITKTHNPYLVDDESGSGGVTEVNKKKTLASDYYYGGDY